MYQHMLCVNGATGVSSCGSGAAVFHADGRGRRQRLFRPTWRDVTTDSPPSRWRNEAQPALLIIMELIQPVEHRTGGPSRGQALDVQNAAGVAEGAFLPPVFQPPKRPTQVPHLTLDTLPQPRTGAIPKHDHILLAGSGMGVGNFARHSAGASTSHHPKMAFIKAKGVA